MHIGLDAPTSFAAFGDKTLGNACSYCTTHLVLYCTPHCKHFRSTQPLTSDNATPELAPGDLAANDGNGRGAESSPQAEADRESALGAPMPLVELPMDKLTTKHLSLIAPAIILPLTR